MQFIVRGSSVSFSATCFDAAGAVMTPGSANLYLVYRTLSNGRASQTVVMSIALNVVSAEWDSSIAADGLVTWSIRAIGADTIVQDGSLTLIANEANPIS